jgi:hypothetical protein
LAHELLDESLVESLHEILLLDLEHNHAGIGNHTVFIRRFVSHDENVLSNPLIWTFDTEVETVSCAPCKYSFALVPSRLGLDYDFPVFINMDLLRTDLRYK